MPAALHTETVLIHAPDEPFEPTTGGPQGPPEEPFERGRGGGGGDNDPHRKPTGMGVFGMAIALVPITVLFIAIAVVYYARARNPFYWHVVPVPTLLWLSTGLILASIWTLERARVALKAERHGNYARWLLRTLCLGLGFLASQVLALQQLMTEGSFLRHNPHSSLFYVITGTHGAHLAGGLVALVYLFVRALFHLDESPAGRSRTRRVTVVTAIYWHFLTVLWAGLFLFLLLWQ